VGPEAGSFYEGDYENRFEVSALDKEIWLGFRNDTEVTAKPAEAFGISPRARHRHPLLPAGRALRALGRLSLRARRRQTGIFPEALMRILATSFLLGCLSLFNDVTADMITPLLPAYLASLGRGASFLGAMEGLANAVANMTTLFAGWYADRKVNSRELTVFGYRLSTFARLFLALPYPEVTLAAAHGGPARQGHPHRAARPDHRGVRGRRHDLGEAFGVQRMMDHTGSLFGPLIATEPLALFSVKLPVLFPLRQHSGRPFRPDHSALS
jgi:hypothetical protein